MTWLLDAHMHLQEGELGKDVEGVVRRARGEGVRYLVCNGMHEGDWAQVAELARRYPEIVPCFGMHPWYVNDRSPRWREELERYLDMMPSAVGETGLDRWKEPYDEAAQEEVFRAELALARERRRPIMIHVLRAWEWTMDVLRSEAPLPAGFLMHAYAGSAEVTRELVAMGGYFSFPGNILDAKRAKFQEALAIVPLDRLLLETDSPALPPPAEYGPYNFQGADGRTWGQPANLRAMVRGMAGIRGMTEEVLAEAMAGNARRFLGDLLERPTRCVGR